MPGTWRRQRARWEERLAENSKGEGNGAEQEWSGGWWRRRTKAESDGRGWWRRRTKAESDGLMIAIWSYKLNY